jgi:hypothetical protein
VDKNKKDESSSSSDSYHTGIYDANEIIVEEAKEEIERVDFKNASSINNLDDLKENAIFKFIE